MSLMKMDDEFVDGPYTPSPIPWWRRAVRVYQHLDGTSTILNRWHPVPWWKRLVAWIKK